MSMQFVAVFEPDIVTNERSEIRTDINSGETVIPVKNNQGFSTSNYLCLGRVGEETTEVLKISAVNENDKTITVESATRLIIIRTIRLSNSFTTNGNFIVIIPKPRLGNIYHLKVHPKI